MRRIVPFVLTAAMLAACSESPTDPSSSKSPAPAAPSFSVALPGTTASISSGSCSLVSASTGQVTCSYDVANPDGLLLNIYPGAMLAVDYQCTNASTGRVQSSGTGSRWTWAAFEGVTATNPTGTDITLASPTVNNSYTRKDRKFNACKGNQKLIITNYSLKYWEVYLDNWYSGQPNADYTWTCLGADNSRGCATS
jgi:hypothetical protein